MVLKKANKEFWQDRNVLVTGVTGLIGGWVASTLLQLEANLVAVVRDWVPGSLVSRSDLYNKMNVVRGEICDQELLERVIGEYEVETIIHLAAQTIVPIANRNPISTFQSNIAGTWTLLEAARRSPTVRQIIVASSDKAYGQVKELPYLESTPLCGQYPYDVSKSCADLIAQSYANTWNTPVAITRCGNFFGGGDLNWNRIVPGTIRSLLRGKSPIIRSDGTMVRDYIYAEDAVGSYLHLAESLAKNPDLKGNAFNFSNEQPLSVLEMVSRISDAINISIEPIIKGEASHEIEKQYLDSSKSRNLLDWKPLFSLEEGLARTVEWYKRYYG